MWVCRMAWKKEADLWIPMGTLFHSYTPNSVVKAVRGLDSSSSSACQYPLVRSKVENHFFDVAKLMSDSVRGSGNL